MNQTGLTVAAVIPARMASSRFPGKPLTPILGHPMIEHVRRRTLKAPFDFVGVATCDNEIKDLVESHGGHVIMTGDHHRGATDRIEEAARSLQFDVIINVQGDEPLVSVKGLEQVIAPFKNPNVMCSNLVYPIIDQRELHSPHVVKAVLSKTGRILYLSRSIIPGRDIDPGTTYFKQSGIMAFRKNFLHAYAAMAPTPLEVKESVDLLRIIENDFWIQAVISSEETKGVDLPEQVEEIQNLILSNPTEKSFVEGLFNS